MVSAICEIYLGLIISFNPQIRILLIFVSVGVKLKTKIQKT